MTGHVRARGKGTWELKFDVERDPLTSKRRVRYSTFRGTKRQAEVELARLVTAAANGGFVEPSHLTVADFLARWLADWATGNVSAKTAERYEQIIRRHVVPIIGAIQLQKMRAVTLGELYGRLLRGEGEHPTLSPRTVGHVHRVLHRAFRQAAEWELVGQNVASLVRAPRVAAREIAIVPAEKLTTLLTGLRGSPVYSLAVLALGTGLRHGEMLALRWRDVDLDRGVLRVEQSLEVTKAGIHFKSPKTHHGRRSVSLPAAVVTDLRNRWREQQEQRLALGIGKAPPETLVFSRFDGEPMHPSQVTKAWQRAVKAAGMPTVTLHALRHTHASQLIAAGVDVVSVSRRLGHGSPTITLSVYAHLFANTDDRAAAIMDATFAAVSSD